MFFFVFFLFDLDLDWISIETDQTRERARSPVGSVLLWERYPPEFDPRDRTRVSHRDLFPNIEQSSSGLFPGLCLSRVMRQEERDAPVTTESEDSGDIKKDVVLDLYIVVGLFVHV
jgi:hypothetical protein